MGKGLVYKCLGVRKKQNFCSRAIKNSHSNSSCIIFNRDTLLKYFMLCTICKILVHNHRHERGGERQKETAKAGETEISIMFNNPASVAQQIHMSRCLLAQCHVIFPLVKLIWDLSLIIRRILINTDNKQLKEIKNNSRENLVHVNRATQNVLLKFLLGEFRPSCLLF